MNNDFTNEEIELIKKCVRTCHAIDKSVLSINTQHQLDHELERLYKKLFNI